MDEAAEDVKSQPTCEPENEENDSDSVEHTYISPPLAVLAVSRS